jgi:hypothetical protein
MKFSRLQVVFLARRIASTSDRFRYLSTSGANLSATTFLSDWSSKVSKAKTISEASSIFLESLQSHAKDLSTNSTNTSYKKEQRAPYSPLTSFVKRAIKEGELGEAIKCVRLAWGMSSDPSMSILTEVHVTTILALLEGLSQHQSKGSSGLSSEKRSDAALYLVRWFYDFNVSNNSTGTLPIGLPPVVAKASVYNLLLRVFENHGLPRDSLVDGLGTRFGDSKRLTAQHVATLGPESIRVLWGPEKDLGRSAVLAAEERSLPSIRRATASGRTYEPLAERAYLWQARDGLWLRERGHIPPGVRLVDVTADMLNSGDFSRAPAIDSEAIIKQAVNNLGLAVAKATSSSRADNESRPDSYEVIDLRPIDFTSLVDIPEGCSRSIRLIASILREMVGCWIHSNGILHTPRKWVPRDALPNGETITAALRLCENPIDFRHVIDMAEATQTLITGPSLLIGVRIAMSKLKCEQTARLFLSRAEIIEKRIMTLRLEKQRKRTKKPLEELEKTLRETQGRLFEEAYTDARNELISSLFKVRKLRGRREEGIDTSLMPTAASSSLKEVLASLRGSQSPSEKVIISALRLYTELGDQENVSSLAIAILAARSLKFKMAQSSSSPPSIINKLLCSSVDKDLMKAGNPFLFKADVKELSRLYAISVSSAMSTLSSPRVSPSLQSSGLDLSNISVDRPLDFSISTLGIKKTNYKDRDRVSGPSSNLVAEAVHALGYINSPLASSVISLSFLAEAAHKTESCGSIGTKATMSSRMLESYVKSLALLGNLDGAVAVSRAGLVMGACLREPTALTVVKNVLTLDELPYAFSALRVFIDGGKEASDRTQQSLMDLVSRLSRTALPVPSVVAEAIEAQSLKTLNEGDKRINKNRQPTGLDGDTSQINTSRISAFADASLASAVMGSLKVGDLQQDVSVEGRIESNDVVNQVEQHPLVTAVSTSRSLATAIVRLTAQQLQLMADQRKAVVAITSDEKLEKDDGDDSDHSFDPSYQSSSFFDEDQRDNEDALDVACEMLLLCLMEWPVSERMAEVKLELDSETAPRAALKLKRLSVEAAVNAANVSNNATISKPPLQQSSTSSLPLFQMLEGTSGQNNGISDFKSSFDTPAEQGSLIEKRPVPSVVAPALAKLDYFVLGASQSINPPLENHSATMEDLTVALKEAATRARARVAKRAEKREGGAAVAKWDALLTKIDVIISKLRSGKVALRMLHPTAGRSLAKTIAMIAVSGKEQHVVHKARVLKMQIQDSTTQKKSTIPRLL